MLLSGNLPKVTGFVSPVLVAFAWGVWSEVLSKDDARVVGLVSFATVIILLGFQATLLLRHGLGTRVTTGAATGALSGLAAALGSALPYALPIGNRELRQWPNTELELSGTFVVLSWVFYLGALGIVVSLVSSTIVSLVESNRRSRAE